MKRYIKPEQPSTVNINIRQHGKKTEHITAILGSLNSVKIECINAINQSGQFSPIAHGKKTVVEFREFINGQNGKTTSFSIYNTCPETVKKVIESIIEN